MRIPLIAAAWLVLPLASAFAGDPSDERFETRIRPILADHCWKCHGATKQSSGLRLDSREAMLKGGSGEGASVVPGDPEGSPMIRAVRHDGDINMPPKNKLPDEAVKELTDWVKAGAVWPAGGALKPVSEDLAKTHWSYQPVRKVEPAKADPNMSPVDAFLNAKMVEKGLTPAPRADRRTLLRRATFDLTGLPPTPADLDAFLADKASDAEAFARVVDRLLASPTYGERWGRYWLDVARYADTKGYVFTEETKYPFSYTYRDWVVSALNADLPYDQFLAQQIAGDRLPDSPDNRHLAALGFLTVGRRFLQDQNEIIDDRIDVVTRGLLGLSVSCARCHDHKFDPIPTEDYYSLYGVFASSEEPKELPLLQTSEAKASAEYEKKIAELKKGVDAFLVEKRSASESELRSKLAAYLVAADAIDFAARSPKIDETAIAAMLKPEVLRRFAMRWKERADANDPLLAPWKALASLPADGFRDKAAGALEGVKAPKDGKPAPPPALIEDLAKTPPESRKDAARLYGDILAKALADPVDPRLEPIRKWLDSADGPIVASAETLKRSLNRADRNKLRELEKKVAEFDVKSPDAPPRAMVMVDKPKPVEPHVFLRGNPGRAGPAVPRRFLKVISAPERAPFRDGSGRLELARSITDPSNPLTARVMVNRLWMYHFGQGLVRTPSDFGSRGDPPTHPELLDWLAATFVERGWSLKAMHRVVMASDAYARRSEASPDVLAKDPTNLWLAHQNRRRLEYEAMRDSLLASAGRLDPKIGGRPITLETEPFVARRTLYGLIDRYNLEPVYRTFDFPNPDTSSPKRANTTVPQQALYLLNSPFVAEQTRHLAARPEVASGSDEERLRHLYRLLFLRDPRPDEMQLGTRFLALLSKQGNEGLASPWRYGVGRVEGADGVARVADFRAFPHWTGKGWQLGPQLPGPDGSFANLNPEGSHTGKDSSEATVLRWVAPADLTVAVGGTLGHKEKKGDGVRGRVVSDRSGLLGSWDAHGGKAETNVDRVEVKKGETIDFVVDCRTESSFDSYTWGPTIRVVASPTPARRSSWDARTDFHGPEPAGLSPWEAYAQALLLTNEYLYVD